MPPGVGSVAEGGGYSVAWQALELAALLATFRSAGSAGSTGPLGSAASSGYAFSTTQG